MGKKIKGFELEKDNKSKNLIIKDRHGYTVASKPNMQLAMEWINKDRRYVNYQPSIGGLNSKKEPIKCEKRKVSKKISKMNKLLKK